MPIIRDFPLIILEDDRETSLYSLIGDREAVIGVYDVVHLRRSANTSHRFLDDEMHQMSCSSG